MAKILLVTGDAAEALEVMYPYQRLREVFTLPSLLRGPAAVQPPGHAKEQK
jgi:hypothetical protein